MKPTIYLDISVIGGCFDPEFARWSNGLVKDFQEGNFIPVLSEVVAQEIEVRSFLQCRRMGVKKQEMRTKCRQKGYFSSDDLYKIIGFWRQLYTIASPSASKFVDK